LLLVLGVAIGAFGTLIGAGGGSLLVPALLLLYPHEEPKVITAVSLAVVFCNALSGTIAYHRQRRIDYASGWRFAAAVVPGAVLGALVTGWFHRTAFDLLFGTLMVAGAAYLLVWPTSGSSGSVRPGSTHRILVDRAGTRYEYSFEMWVGALASTGVGFVSSLLGIGGGIIHVPALRRLLNFPTHVATATSHFLLVVMAGAGTLAHILAEHFHRGVRRTALLGVGVIIGAQIGAAISQHARGRLIMRLLAVSLLFAGLWVLVGRALHP
jgi:hypothetical protein